MTSTRRAPAELRTAGPHPADDLAGPITDATGPAARADELLRCVTALYEAARRSYPDAYYDELVSLGRVLDEVEAHRTRLEVLQDFRHGPFSDHRV